MHPTLLFYSCLTQDDFTRQGESTATQWVIGMCRILFCRIPDSSLPDTGQEKMMTG
jgi:hypothetical protein